jgi:ceramide glucosyltransferase
VLEDVIAAYPGHDAKILVADEDPCLREGAGTARMLGPNPKIRNMSRGYREAKGDIIWILDCNVWVGRGVAGRMVDKLCGLSQRRAGELKNKFVHQLPLVVDVGNSYQPGHSSHPNGTPGGDASPDGIPGKVNCADEQGNWWFMGVRAAGSQLEEMFMSSSHAKFYTAINTVLIAPCILGKSNMFRRSHLDQLTSTDGTRPSGIDYFSYNICEDHLVGDLLWNGKLAEERAGKKWGKHAMVFGDLAIQPMAGMTVGGYLARRVRWLRVRKFTVTLATLVEPGTESFLCSLYGAYAVTTHARHFCGLTDGTSQQQLLLPPSALLLGFWVLSVSLWAIADRVLYLHLHAAKSIEIDKNTPPFVRPLGDRPSASLPGWLFAWLGREALAFPIWAWAMFGGTTVTWRGKRFWVNLDMRVHEIGSDRSLSAKAARELKRD